VVVVYRLPDVDLIELKLATVRVTGHDVLGVREPNGVIVVFEELALHLQYLDVVKLLQVVADLVALLHAVCILVCLDQIKVLADATELILDVASRLVQVKWRVEVDHYFFAETPLGLDAGLHVAYRFPVEFNLWDLEGLHEVVISKDLDTVNQRVVLCLRDIGCFVLRGSPVSYKDSVSVVRIGLARVVFDRSYSDTVLRTCFQC